jgi:hypothetical protein
MGEIAKLFICVSVASICGCFFFFNVVDDGSPPLWRLGTFNECAAFVARTLDSAAPKQPKAGGPGLAIPNR